MLIFITKIYTQESYFYAEDKNFNLILSKLLYYNILRCQGYLLMFWYPNINFINLSPLHPQNAINFNPLTRHTLAGAEPEKEELRIIIFFFHWIKLILGFSDI